VSKKLIIIAAAGVLVLGGGGAAAWELGMFGRSGGGAPAVKAAEPPKVAYVEVREMTLRLADTDTEHYMKISPVLAVLAPEKDSMEDRLPIARDRIVAVVTARTSTDLSSPEGQKKLKKDLVTTLHQDFHDTLVDIYFSDYLVE
jgi:flagellar FliL protein